MTSAQIKTIGYFVSSVSVVLLGIVSWHSAKTDPLLAIALFCGMSSSVLGMALRWVSYRMEKG